MQLGTTNYVDIRQANKNLHSTFQFHRKEGFVVSFMVFFTVMGCKTQKLTNDFTNNDIQ